MDRCIDFAKDFIVSGTASDQLFGTCESLWEPDMVSVFLAVLASVGCWGRVLIGVIGT